MGLFEKKYKVYYQCLKYGKPYADYDSYYAHSEDEAKALCIEELTFFSWVYTNIIINCVVRDRD